MTLNKTSIGCHLPLSEGRYFVLSKRLSSTHVRPHSAWATNTCGCIWCSELQSSTVFADGPVNPAQTHDHLGCYVLRF